MSSDFIFTILTVDGNLANLATLNSMLKSVDNIKIYEAKSGKEALEISSKEKIDLILLDTQLAELDGFEVAKLLKNKQATKDIPIIFTTDVFQSEEFLQKGYEVGAIDYLTKPIDDNFLLNKIKMYQRLFFKTKDIEESFKKRVESEQVFATVFNHAGMSIGVCNRDGEFIKTNKEFENLLGYQEDLLKKNILEILHPQDLEQYKKSLHSVMKNGENHFAFKGKFLKKDGSSIWVKATISSVENNDSQAPNLIVIAEDLTEYKQQEIEKKKQNDLLIKQSRLAEMGEIIGSIAHQWRQPLNSLSITIQDLLDAEEFGELNRKYLEKNVGNALGQIEYMSKTIDDFRNFFKPNKEKEKFQIFETINETIDLISAQLKDNGIKLNFSKKSSQNSDKCTILGYKNEFKQAILNIINNSKDAILEQQQESKDLVGTIDISISSAKDSIKIEIQDNGGGINKDPLEKIFEPYVSTKDKNGTGLGLYMVKSIIEDNMGGTVFGKNVADGALFTVILKVN